jgi:hypothetical protein
MLDRQPRKNCKCVCTKPNAQKNRSRSQSPRRRAAPKKQNSFVANTVPQVQPIAAPKPKRTYKPRAPRIPNFVSPPLPPPPQVKKASVKRTPKPCDPPKLKSPAKRCIKPDGRAAKKWGVGIFAK